MGIRHRAMFTYHHGHFRYVMDTLKVYFSTPMVTICISNAQEITSFSAPRI